MTSEAHPQCPVLLVDDEAQFLQSASFSLRSAGMNNVLKCEDSRRVMDLLAENTCSTIVLDILMPHITGRELLPQITKKYPATPVIMLTALNEVDTAVECMKNGAYDFLLKPIDKTHLVGTISRAVEYYQMHSENVALNQSLREANRELEEKTRRQEELLKKLTTSTTQLTSIIDSARNVIVLVDADNRILEVNRHTATYFDVDPDSVRGQPFDAFTSRIQDCFEDPEKFGRVLHERTHSSFENQMKGLYSDLDRESRLLVHKPLERIISIFFSPVGKGDDSGMGHLWTFNDITAFVRADEQLRTIVEAAPIPVIITSARDGRIIYCNENLGTLGGYSPEEMVGRSSLEFYANPDERASLMESLKRDGVVRNFEIQFRTRSGELLWTLLSLSLTTLNNEPVIVGGLYDISPQKQAVLDVENANRNLREAQSQLIQSEKMASLGMLVAGIAHEINTPVGAIASTQDTLVRAVAKLETCCGGCSGIDKAQKDKVSSLFGIIAKANQVTSSAASRVTEIVRRLRSFARLDEAELKTVDIHENLEDTLVILRHELKHGIEVEKNYGPIPQISCFPGRINQVFLNILKNASQAITTPGKITLETSLHGDRVAIKVTDSGCGIEKEKLARIFDPGFTTKGVGVGTGLGLSITYQIIRDHKGEITVDSDIDRGTTFTIYLPVDLAKVLGGGKTPESRA